MAIAFFSQISQEFSVAILFKTNCPEIKSQQKNSPRPRYPHSPRQYLWRNLQKSIQTEASLKRRLTIDLAVR
ncbi:MAG: hypothetical protein WBB82_10260 [Limnothrix sp.]